MWVTHKFYEADAMQIASSKSLSILISCCAFGIKFLIGKGGTVQNNKFQGNAS